MASSMQAQCVEHCGNYHWSGNWAALVGVGMCLFLLWLWLDVRYPRAELEEDDGR